MVTPTLRDRDETKGIERSNIAGAARHALPAGHPVSWGAITAGTWLEGRDFDDALKECGGVSRLR